MKVQAKFVADITGSEIEGRHDNTVSYLLTDSRKVSELSEGTMFIALKGQKSDGHKYIEQLYSAGVRVFLISDKSYINSKHKEASYIIAQDSLEAVHKLAQWKRNEFQGKLISITGSNGKTIVKEWLSDILSREKSVIRSPRSYNSQIGVPLSLWNLDNDFDIAVIEAGMSKPGEIARLEKIIKPEIGVFTHIGEAHQENFSSISEKVNEKLSLFINSDVIIFPADEEEIYKAILIDKDLKDKTLFPWSAKPGKGVLQLMPVFEEDKVAKLKLTYGGQEYSFKLPFTDKASIDNISTVITVLIYLGYSMDMIADGLKDLVPVAMRMEQKEGINNCLLLEDFYNSDPASLKIAIDYIKGLSDKNISLILSDFMQSAKNKSDLYIRVANDLQRSGINRLIGIGPELIRYRDVFKTVQSLFYEDTDQFISAFSQIEFRNEAILIKGARIFEFEKIGRLLELKTHQTQLEINLEAVLSNLNKFRTYLKPGVKVMAMVKAFAYGAGSTEISEWLSYNGIDYLAVAYTDEGIGLRKSGIASRIMVMNPDKGSLRTIIEYDLEPEIYNMDILRLFSKEVKSTGLSMYPVHIKLDTGMHRLGFMQDDIDSLISFLNTNQTVRPASVFSHLAAAYDPEMDKYTRSQTGMFISICNKIEAATGMKFLKHILNSAGIIRFSDYQFDMVRLGIGLYGLPEVGMEGLKNAASFYTRISQVKTIDKGEGVGYGLNDHADKRRTIAILPVGYADGLRRIMSQGRGRVYAGGRHFPIIGNICMDMCMIDISGSDLKAGDRIEIFGDNIPVMDIASVCNTIPYEIISGIPERVKRIYLYE